MKLNLITLDSMTDEEILNYSFGYLDGIADRKKNLQPKIKKRFLELIKEIDWEVK